MSRLTRVLVFPATTLALSASLAGCGGTSTASPQEWTSALCKALTPLAAHGAALQTSLGSQGAEVATNPSGVRDRFATSLGQLAADFEAGRAAAEKAGAPEVKDGAAIQQEVVTGLERTAKVFADAKAKVTAAPPDAKAVSAAVLAASQSITTGFESFGNAFTKLGASTELSKEGDKNPDCKVLNKG